MKNLLLANLCRLLRGMSIYITIFLLLALSTLIVTTEATFTGSRAYYGAGTLQHIIIGMSNMAYLMLALAIFVSGAAFTTRAIQNEIAFGISRTKIYFSHLALSLILSVIFIVAFVAWAVILATILRGFGYVPQGFWFEKIGILSIQILLLLALNALATFLIFTIKRTSIVMGVYFAILIVPSLLIEMLSFFNEEIVRLRTFDIAFNLRLAAQLSTLDSSQIIQILGLGIGAIVVTTVVGVTWFKWVDI